MENLVLSFNVVAPMVLMMVMGVILRKFNLLSDTTCASLNGLVYKIFIPISIFCNVYAGNLEDMVDFRPILFAAIALTGIYAVMMIVVKYIEPERTRRPVMVQAVTRSNFVIFGVPVATALLGDGNIAGIVLMVVLLAPYYNFLSVLAFSLHGEHKPNFKKVLKDIVTNPIIIASLIALVFLLCKIPLPQFVFKTLDSFGDMASPIAFMILGATFSFKMSKGVARAVFISVGTRLIIVPALLITLSVLLGFRGVYLIGLVTLFGSPTAVASYAMATHLGGDGETASKIIVYSSCFSMITMFCIILILKTLCII